MMKIWVLLVVTVAQCHCLTQESVNASSQDSNRNNLCTQERMYDGTVIINCSSRGLDNLVTEWQSDQTVVLDISNNHIHQLDNLPDVDSFSKVIELNLTRNQIQRLHGDIFKKMKALKALDLSFNRLMKWGFFNDEDGLSNFQHDLESIDLSNNKISELTSSSFSFFNDITSLNMSFNVLMKVDENSFKKLKFLKKLDLSHNKLNSLPSKLFSKLTSLSHLYLSNNNLLSVPVDVPILNWFDLSFNKISVMEESFSHVIYPHEVILLGGNPFRCDCKLLWLKEFYDTREYLLKFIDVDKDRFIPICDSPDSLKGDTWDVIGDDVFDCDKDADNIEIDNLVLPDDDIEESIHPTEQDESDITELKSSDIVSNSVKLEWLVIAADFVVVTYRTFGDKKEKKAAVLPTPVSSMVLRNLEANTPYIICIAITEKLNSDNLQKKKCIEVMTAEENRKFNDKTAELLVFMAKISFDNRFIIGIIFSLTVIIVCIIFFLGNDKKKEKQS